MASCTPASLESAGNSVSCSRTHQQQQQEEEDGCYYRKQVRLSEELFIEPSQLNAP